MKGIVGFVVGVATGAAATWYVTKKYYQMIADEEIESVKEEFLKVQAEKENKKEQDAAESDKDNYTGILVNNGYAVKEDLHEQPGGAEPGIELIPPDECGDDPSYGFDSLTYYSDGILAIDRNGEIIRDIQHTVSELAIRSFGTYEQDAIHVRNDNDEMYYEIHRVSCTYRQANGEDPEEEV